MEFETKSRIDNIGATIVVVLLLSFILVGLGLFVCSVELTTSMPRQCEHLR